MTTRITSRLIAGCLLAFALAALVGVRLSAQHASTTNALKKTAAPKGQLVVHEWGTFTSIAGRHAVAPCNRSERAPFVNDQLTFGRSGLLQRISRRSVLSGKSDSDQRCEGEGEEATRDESRCDSCSHVRHS